MLLIRTLQTKFNVTSLRSIRNYYSVKNKVIKDENYISRHIHQKILAKGPITVADYMKYVLTNPMAGYYMHKDMLGEEGDFVTSPEISQMFGEMIAVWFLNEWQKMGSPKPLQLLELGPGRGTLMNDILNVFSHFNALHKTSLHLVEISPLLSDLQSKTLGVQTNYSDKACLIYRKGITSNGIPVTWYRQLSDVPMAFTLILAHEFFDALPIHKFHRTFGGYREVLIDIDKKNLDKKNYAFKYVLARHDTPMSKVLIGNDEFRDHLEVSPDTVSICKQIFDKIRIAGGLALICDYGHNGEGTDTFRAFRKHKQVDPLSMPGNADLTADVDFNKIREVASEDGELITLGPVKQREFLMKTGLEYRVNALAQSIKDKRELENLIQCYKFLTDTDKMGERFKFCAVFPKTMKKIYDKCPVVGFT